MNTMKSILRFPRAFWAGFLRGLWGDSDTRLLLSVMMSFALAGAVLTGATVGILHWNYQYKMELWDADCAALCRVHAAEGHHHSTMGCYCVDDDGAYNPARVGRDLD